MTDNPERPTYLPDVIKRPLALGAVCLSALGAILPPAGASTLVPAPDTHTPQGYVAEMQSYINQSQVPTPVGVYEVGKKSCGEGEAGVRASCIFTSGSTVLHTVLLNPSLKQGERRGYLMHEFGHFTDLALVKDDAGKSGRQPDFISGVTLYRTQLLQLGGKAKSYAQAKYLIQHGPTVNADGSPVKGARYWAQEYVAQLYAQCAIDPTANPGQEVQLQFYGKGVNLRASAYDKACRFIKRYLSADRQQFEVAPH